VTFKPASVSTALPENTSSHDRHSLNILVAEDNEFNVQLLEQLLIRQGYRVCIASNGRQALELLGVASSQQPGTGGSRDQSRMASGSRPPAVSFDLLLLD